MTSLNVDGLVLLLSLTIIYPVTCKDTVCTYIYNQTCVDKVKEVMADNTLFWFGTAFKTTCPQGAGGMGQCFNSRSNVSDSLITRMLGDDDATSDSVEFVVNVTYTLPAKRSYMGCGAMINKTSEEVTYKKIDPVSRNKVYAFDASTEPSVRWPNQDGVKYTVVYYDVGFNILHGIYVNVDGGDISLGQVALPHRGPKNTLSRQNTYVWAVFKQLNDLVVSDVKTYVRSNQQFTGAFLLAPFLAHFNLTGPFGVNTVRAVGDEYAAHYMRNMGVFNRCPMYLQNRLQEHVNARGGLTFNLSSSVATKSIDLHFVLQPMSFMSCCKNQELRSVNKTVDFKSMSEATASQMRGKPRVRIVPEMLRDTLQDQYFTLMIVDPTRDFNSSTPGAVVHWLIVNIPSTNVTSGMEVLSYRPLVPGKMDEMFLVLLYKQSAGSSEAIKDISGLYGSDCPVAFKDRCMFNVKDFVTRNNLVLNGLRPLKVMTDPYSRYRQVKDKMMQERDACKGMNGYADPCPTGTAQVLKSTSVFGVLSLVLVSAFC